MKTVDQVDIDRFMGPWYVIANIPTFLEKGAHNAVETYSLNDDGTIATQLHLQERQLRRQGQGVQPEGICAGYGVQRALGNALRLAYQRPTIESSI